MPWQECQKMDERLRFVGRLLEGEKMAALCREFDISRQTGHKFYKRYKDLGLQGLTDRSRRPYRQANRLPEALESRIVQLRREHPSWGAPKIREKIKRLGLGVSLPAISTVHAVLDRHGWSAADGAAITSRLKEPACPDRISPMICGALITRASSCSPITATAIP